MAQTTQQPSQKMQLITSPNPDFLNILETKPVSRESGGHTMILAYAFQFACIWWVGFKPGTKSCIALDLGQ